MSLTGRGTKKNMSASQNEELKTMKNVDGMLAGVVKPRYIVPIATDNTGAAIRAGYYEDNQTMPLDEKFTYATLATQQAQHTDPPTIQVNLTEEDVQVVKEKAMMATLKDFDRWVINQLGQSGLTAEEKRQWLKQVYPQFLDRMEQAAHYVIENEGKYKKMQLTNPQSIEDMVWMYFFEKYTMIETSNFDFMDILNGVVTRPTANAFNGRARMAFERGTWNAKKRFMDYMNEWSLDHVRDASPANAFLQPNRDDMLHGWAVPSATDQDKRYPTWGYNRDVNHRLTLQQAQAALPAAGAVDLANRAAVRRRYRMSATGGNVDV